MANIIKPLQLAVHQQVLEQNNEFHYIVSATMGVRLSTGEALLEFDFFKEAFEHMGDKPLPDMGMPKPQAEYVVSGSYYAPENKEVTAGEIKVKVADKEKSLFVFGEREWVMGAPTKPEPITSMPLTYSNAYGGNGYESNPDGIGYDDIKLPLIENPDQLLTSNKQNIQPAGLSPLDLSLPQRMQYQGTYDDTYLDKYYPGYPEDFDWRFFMSTAQDQWQENYFIGNESFELHNLHPENSVINGKLPGYVTRCFMQQKVGETTQFDELSLNLDTVWFFPETDLALLIWRGGIDVADDEASSVSDLVLAYEAASDPVRPVEYYQAALEKRLNSDDALLNNFNTTDLIPVDAKCAMELLQENALADSGDSPFSDNLDAKAEALQNMVDKKLQEVNEQVEKNIEIPDQVPAKEQQAIKDQLDIKEQLSKSGDLKPDAETVELNKKMEAILPGITSGDPKKLNLKEFSFNKIEELMAVIDKFMDGKQALAIEELEKANKITEEKIADEMKNMDHLPDEEKERIKKMLAGFNVEEVPKEIPMARMNSDELEKGMSELSPQLAESMQQVEMLKAMGGDDEAVKNAEKMISDAMNQQQADMSEMMHGAESEFKELYIMAAHGQPQCSSPHKEEITTVTENFLDRVRKKQAVSNMDWACIDLSGKVLDGLDLSGAYLEQVNFTNASLKGCNFEGAILARAILNNADCSSANFDNANMGAVIAHSTIFMAAHFKETILSNSDFSHSTFHSSILEDVQTLEIKIDGVDFTSCKMERMKFIELEYKNATFKDALLNGSVFLQCKVSGCDYSSAIMRNCVWANTSISNGVFDGADMTSTSFSSTEGEQVVYENNSFQESNLEKANFLGLSMPKSNFRKANIQSANFSEAVIKQADFSYANAKQALFRKATLTQCNFDNANIMEGIMTKAYLSGASFRNANLYAVDFLRSTMGETDFSGANLDNTIIRDWQPS